MEADRMFLTSAGSQPSSAPGASRSVLLALLLALGIALSGAGDPLSGPVTVRAEPARIGEETLPNASPADTLSLDFARRLTLSGRYDEAFAALDRFIERGAEPGEVSEAERYLLQTLIETGRYDDARAAIPSPAPPRLAAEAIEFLLSVGDYEAAESLLEQTGARHPESAALELAGAQLALARGERDAARSRLERISLPSRADSTRSAHELLVGGRAAWLRSDLGMGDQFQAAKDLFQAAYARDPDLIEARLLTAALYMEKYESKLARGELDPVLRRNPRHPEAKLLLARIDFADGRYRTVEDLARAALEVNPDHPGALEMLATIQLADEEIHAAAATIEAGLLINPRSRRLLALRAAMLAQAGDVAAAEEEVRALLDADPEFAEAYQVIGGVFDRLRRYDDAAVYYKRAAAIDPGFAPAANALGLLYMRDGREDEAREWLDRGFELDQYNIRTYNMRLLFKQLDAYERFETRHFVIKVDASDRSLLPLMARELEAIYAEQTARFGFEPDRKTTVEIFPTHELLSSRLVGMPGVQGIPAACFGAVIASDSPRIWEGRNNWRTVMAHEFGHVLALERTRKRVPHWFTEGLSVVLEEHVAPEQWDRLAQISVERGELIAFDALNHGFTRSRSMLERNLAYYKSSFAVGYLIETHGWDAMLAVLDDYALDRSTSTIIPTRLGVAANVFAAEVDSLFLEQVTSAPVWGPPVRAELMASIHQADAQPDDPDRRAEMALQWMRNGEYETAVGEALTALEDQPAHPKARFVLGHALLEQDEPFLAVDYLEPLVEDEAATTLLDERPFGYLVVRDLGMIYADIGEGALAQPYLESAIEAYPSDPAAYRKLADVHEQAGRIDEALAVLDALVESQPTAYDDLLRMAAIAERTERHAAAALALERALWVRPYELEVARRFAAAARRDGAMEGAVRGLETVCLLAPDDLAAHEELVELCLEHGPMTTARRYLPRLLELDPDSAVGRRLLERP